MNINLKTDESMAGKPSSLEFFSVFHCWKRFICSSNILSKASNPPLFFVYFCQKNQKNQKKKWNFPYFHHYIYVLVIFFSIALYFNHSPPFLITPKTPKCTKYWKSTTAYICNSIKRVF